jgi:hypothetical protein
MVSASASSVSAAAAVLPSVGFHTAANCAKFCATFLACAAHGWLRVRAVAARIVDAMPAPLPLWTTPGMRALCVSFDDCISCCKMQKSCGDVVMQIWQNLTFLM